MLLPQRGTHATDIFAHLILLQEHKSFKKLIHSCFGRFPSLFNNPWISLQQKGIYVAAGQTGLLHSISDGQSFGWVGKGPKKDELGNLKSAETKTSCFSLNFNRKSIVKLRVFHVILWRSLDLRCVEKNSTSEANITWVQSWYPSSVEDDIVTRVPISIGLYKYMICILSCYFQISLCIRYLDEDTSPLQMVNCRRTMENLILL